MAVTRSSNKPRQAKLEDFPNSKEPTEGAPRIKPTAKSQKKETSTTKPATLKRKAHSSKDKLQPFKKPKSEARTQQAHFSSNNTTQLEKPITINRAPVLHLWSAVVASKTHPDLSWQACLNIGSAVSTLCAISKGKATGMIAAPQRSEEEEAKRKHKKEKARSGADEVEVLGVKLSMKGGAVILSGKAVNVKEENLIGKYGGEEVYEKVKKSFEDAVVTWEEDVKGLNSKAFKMYEKFRPTVPTGGKGWGRKGELNLEHMKSVVRQK